MFGDALTPSSNHIPLFRTQQNYVNLLFLLPEAVFPFGLVSYLDFERITTEYECRDDGISSVPFRVVSCLRTARLSP